MDHPCTSAPPCLGGGPSAAMPSVASKPAVGNPAVTALVRGLLVGLLGKGAFALLPPLFRRQLPTGDATLATLRFAAFMALWCGGTRAVLRALVKSARHGGTRGAGGAAASMVSAAVAGGSLMLATPGDRRMMGLWVGVRGAAALVRLLADKGWIPSVRHPSLLVMMFIAAMLMHSLLYTPGEWPRCCAVPRAPRAVSTCSGGTASCCERVPPPAPMSIARRRYCWEARGVAWGCVLAPHVTCPPLCLRVLLARGRVTPQTAFPKLTGHTVGPCWASA